MAGHRWAERIDDATMLWHMTYRTTEDGVELDAPDVEHLWNVIDSTTLEHELAPHNLGATAVDANELGILRIESGASNLAQEHPELRHATAEDA